MRSIASGDRLWRRIAALCGLLLSGARVLAITAAHAVLYGVRRAMMGRDADPAGVARLRGIRLAALLEHLGPTYVKLGQVLSTRPDLVCDALAAGLSRLQERVREVPARAILGALRTGLDRDPAELFAFVAPRPLACGSIAQVHRATMHDGREVVLRSAGPASFAGSRRTSRFSTSWRR